MAEKYPFIDREISWLSFNERVLQEASDIRVPLIERLKFLAIFSSNLDEFYRVRVATMSKLAEINDKSKQVLGLNAKKTLHEIKNIVIRHERKFEHLFEHVIMKELADNKIFIINDKQLNVSKGEFVRQYFRDKVLSAIVPIMLDIEQPLPELTDRALCFFVRLNSKSKPRYAIIEIPSDLERFLILPETNGLQHIILIEEVVRYCLDDIFYLFKCNDIEAYTIQMTRDSEIILDTNIGEKFLDDLRKGLDKRKFGKPMRLLYDANIPLDMLTILVNKYKIRSDALIPSTGYNKFGDFINFPDLGRKDLVYDRIKPLMVKGIGFTSSLFQSIAKKDFIVHVPYQTYDYTILFLREAAIDPKVTEISITLYRLAKNSKVANALINAAKNGKKVNCLVELKARFDENANLAWTKKLSENGVNVIYGMSNLKVHSKICLVKRKEKNKQVYYANVATGNFNENTAKIYCDHSLFTANKEITNELRLLFDFISKNQVPSGFKKLVVSPVDVRPFLYKLIDQEIKNAKSGKVAYMIFKMNSLADEEVIQKLYRASQAGVKIQLIIRGICCLVPGVKGVSENITAISIVDKFLEHARIWVFANGGDEKMYLTSADLMTRNLDHRVEVGFPILDQDIRNEIRIINNIQLNDNSKARILNASQLNRYKKNKAVTEVRAQIDIYDYLKVKNQ